MFLNTSYAIFNFRIVMIKFDMIRKYDMNLTQFLRIWVMYNRILVIFVLIHITRLINWSYSC